MQSQTATRLLSALTECYDVAVVGAGVVGCAVARRFTLEGARVVVLEKASDFLDGASKANSALLHTGFDEPPDFLESDCIRSGYEEYLEIHTRLNLPILRTGALVLAWSAQQELSLDKLLGNAHANGVIDAKRLTVAEIRRREPNLGTDVHGGFIVPSEFVIDPWSTPFAYLLQAIENGAHYVPRSGVTDGEFDGEHWRLHTNGGDFHAKTVINCAGLYGDQVDQALLGEVLFQIKPRKGQFLVYDKAASALLKTILLPVPTELTKGVVVTPTIFGNILVGPTAEEQESRDDAGVTSEVLNHLQAQGERLLPALRNFAITATYAGIRPASEQKDYRIRFFDERRYVSVGGIRSTGLSAALGIAGYVFEQASNMHLPMAALPQPIWPRVPNLAQSAERDWQRSGNGGIVCHCEWVTRREIEQALSGPAPAHSLAALKRRTRVTMGRCQGFYCSAELARMTVECFDEPMACPVTDD